MTDDLTRLRAGALAAITDAADLRALDAVRVQLLGKSGTLTALLKELGRTPPDERRARGAALNELRDAISAALEARRADLDARAIAARLAAERMDITLPPAPEPPGSIHPISRTMEEIAAIFGAMGFAVAEGPDVESDWHNFSALNIRPTTRPATTTTPSTSPA